VEEARISELTVDVLDANGANPLGILLSMNFAVSVASGPNVLFHAAILSALKSVA
jgi:hypothetical protein